MSTSPYAHQVTRRPELDGLRALAIVSVMLFHYDANWLPGGFVGVDVFFVISAYLITGRIVSLMREGRFSFAEFYVRRIRRIFPASIFVFMLVVLAASQLNGLLLPNSIYVLGFMYNKFAVDYFTADAQSNFFLHYWSLSIEEQFYFVWPLLLLPLVWFSRWEKTFQLHYPWILSSLVCVVFFALGIMWSFDSNYQSDLYFLSIPRFGEMACGAWMATLPKGNDLPDQWRRFGSVSGVLLLAGSFAFVTKVGYPGWQAVFPCLGAALLIGCAPTLASARSNVIYRILGARPVVFIGMISFSLYLWHWPLFSVLRFVSGQSDLPLSWAPAVFGLTFCLSVATYYFVEQPFQSGTAQPARVAGGFLAVNFVAVTVLVLMTGNESLKIPPVIGADYTNVTVNGQNMRLTDGWIAPCFDRAFKNPSPEVVDEECGIGALGRRPTVLLVGDSHSAALGAFVDAVGKKEGFRVTALAVGACQVAEWGMASRAPDVVRTPERINNCEMMLRYIKDHHKRYKAIYVANAFNLFSGDYDVFKKSLGVRPKFVFDELKDISAVTPVYFFHDSPVLDRSMQKSPVMSYFGFELGANVVVGGEEGNSAMRTQVQSRSGLFWVDLSEYYKVLERDAFLHQGWPVYVDTNHLNARGGRVLADLYLSSPDGCLSCLSVRDQVANAE